MLSKYVHLFIIILSISYTPLWCEDTAITLSYLEKERGKNQAFEKAYKAALEIRKISQKILSKDEAAHIAWFIETKLPQEIHHGNDFFECSNTQLAFPIEYDPKSKLTFIHLGSHKEGSIGKGKCKIVTKSILYHPEHPELVANCEAESSLKHEIVATKLLASKPGIFHVYAITQHKKDKKTHTSILCKLYNRGSLERFIKRHGSSLTLQEKMHMALNVLEGLRHIHESGFVHRDLGTRNYLVNVSHDPKTKKRVIDAVIADLGRTLPLEDAVAKVAQGNSSYTPPEGLEIERLMAKDYCAIDIYALGCALFRLQYPKQEVPHFPVKQCIKEGKGTSQLKKKFVKTLRDFLEEKQTQLSHKKSDSQQAEFEKLILKMVHYDPQCRGNAQELTSQLKKIMSKEV